MLSKVGYHSSNSEHKNIEHLMQLSNGASTAVIVESELPEYFKLAHIALVLPADRSNLNNLFEQSARLGCVVLAYDHKVCKAKPCHSGWRVQMILVDTVTQRIRMQIYSRNHYPAIRKLTKINHEKEHSGCKCNHA